MASLIIFCQPENRTTRKRQDNNNFGASLEHAYKKLIGLLWTLYLQCKQESIATLSKVSSNESTN